MNFDDINPDHNGHDEDEDEGEGGEFEVNIDPREDDLDRHGIDQAQFEEALYAALDARGESLEAAGPDDVARSLEDVELSIGGKSYRLGELADVSIDEPGSEFED